MIATPGEDHSLRRHWTPYMIVDSGDCYRVYYLAPREELPDNAFLFLVPHETDGEINMVRDAAQNLMFRTPLLNKWRV